MDDDKNFVLQWMLPNIAKEISKHVPARDLDYPTLCTVMCTRLFSPLVYSHAKGNLVLSCLKGNLHNKFYTLQSLSSNAGFHLIVRIRTKLDSAKSPARPPVWLQPTYSN